MTESLTGLHVYLAYRDAPAALGWLERALGFTTTMRFDDEQGRVAHAELRRDDVAFIVFSDAGVGYDRPSLRGDTVGQGVYFSVADRLMVDEAWGRALAAAATPVWTPDETEWGNYRCRVRDPEDHEWTFGTHHPGREVVGDQ